nr:Structural ORFs [Bat bocavirus]
MSPINRKPGGWVLPGYKYLGPFNPLDNGEPVNKADQAAKEHDKAYDDYIKQGVNPYLKFNKADNKFIEDLKEDKSIGGFIGRGAFNLKRVLFPHLKENLAPAAKRQRIELSRTSKRKLYFAKQNQSKPVPEKKPKMEAVENPDQTDSGQPQPANSSSTGTSTGTGGGGHGVGVSTGGWEGGTWFGNDTVVTTVTRQWYTAIQNGHKYTHIEQKMEAHNLKPVWTGIQTPWSYFNFNCYHSHFSPQDWQRLVNEYKRWRPKKMEVKIYNLQIKQVVTLGADTLYNNDLTAGMHIFCDGSHQYPYAQHPWDEGTLPELPNAIWKLPNYAYFQVQGDLIDDETDNSLQNMEAVLKKTMPLYMLENSSHDVLRTGESAHFNFSFECGWVHNDRAYCAPQQDFNPLVRTRRYFPTRSVAENRYTFSRYSPYKKPSNWMPGPGIAWKGSTTTANFPADARGPIVTVYAPRGTVPNSSEVSNVPDRDGDVNVQTQGVRQSGFSTCPANGACSKNDYPNLSYDATDNSETADSVATRNIDIDMTRWHSAYKLYRTGTTGGPDAGQGMNEMREVWMYPNQAWNGTPITRDTPIWDKVPRTDFHTILDSSDGTLPMAHPPGTIFVKVAKIPIPTSTNADAYLTLYVTGQVTCRIEWEVERYQTKNWRPEIRQSATAFTHSTVYNIDKDGQYTTPDHFGESMPTRMGFNRVL